MLKRNWHEISPDTTKEEDSGKALRRIIFLWENFGPMHNDRCDAITLGLPGRLEVIGLELYQQSEVYDWKSEESQLFRKLNLFSSCQRPTGWRLWIALTQTRRSLGPSVWFICHYERLEIFLFAIWLRLHGDQVFAMGCSKFDDKVRKSLREAIKTLFLLPYKGAIGSGIRSRDYFRFLGIRRNRIVGEYNTVSVARIRILAMSPPAPAGIDWKLRHFIIVARFVPKKNISIAIEAFALYVAVTPRPRALYLCGSGPLESELRAQVVRLGLCDHVVFEGFLQSDMVARRLATSLLLLLPSIEEQFGNVIIEAQAMGLPVILSPQCGAADHLVRNGINGYLVEPDNPEGMAYYMSQVGSDEALWRRLCVGANAAAPRGDVARFVEAVHKLVFGEEI